MIYRFRLIIVASITFAFFMLTLSVVAQVRSQSTEQLPWSVGIHAGVTRTRLIDAAFSRLDFKGYGAAAGLAVIHRGIRLEQVLKVSVLKGTPKNSQVKDIKADEVMFDLTYSALFRLTGSNEQSFSVMAGPGIRLFYSDRRFDQLINRNHSFENLADLELVAGFNYNLEVLVPGLSVSDYLSTAVMAAYSDETTQKKLGAATLSTTNAGFSNIFSYHRFVAVPDVVAVTNALTVRKNILEKHAIGLSYDWQYYRFKPGYETKQSNHRLSIFYNYNF